MNGERPTHPELLDYLAQSFVDNGHVDQGAAPRDHAERGLSAERRRPAGERSRRTRGNRLYWRANRQRMTAEQIRDSVLFVSGALDTKHRRAVGAADAARRPAHGLRQGQPLQARRVPAALRLPEPEPVRRAALLDQRAAAAAVLHEQRLHAAAGRAAGRAGRRRARRRARGSTKAYRLRLRPRADGRRGDGRPRRSCKPKPLQAATRSASARRRRSRRDKDAEARTPRRRRAGEATPRADGADRPTA